MKPYRTLISPLAAFALVLGVACGQADNHAVQKGIEAEDSTTSAPAPTTTVAQPKVQGFVYGLYTSLEETSRPESTCGDWASSWQVQVLDGGGTILTVASLENPETISGSSGHGYVHLSCKYGFNTSVPQRPVYTTRVISESSQRVMDSKTVSAEQLPTRAVVLNVDFSVL